MLNAKIFMLFLEFSCSDFLIWFTIFFHWVLPSKSALADAHPPFSYLYSLSVNVLHACQGDSSVPLFLLVLALSWSNRCLSLLLVTASPHTFHLTPPLKGVHTIIGWQERRVCMCMCMSCIRCSVFACATGCHVLRGVFGGARGWMKLWWLHRNIPSPI